MKFYLTGVTAIVSEWLNDDCQATTEMISMIIRKCVTGRYDFSA